MAEERLIDDDKDRKYRIRKNENGEEELVIIDDEEDEEDFPVYDVVTDEESELSAEQIAERNAERQQNILRKAAEYKATAATKMQSGDYESAQYALSQASEITEYDGELYFLKLKAYSRGMTNFLDLQKCVEASDGVREYSDEAQKKELDSLSAPLQERIKEFSDKCASLGAENERGKAERREVFVKDKNRAFKIFLCTAVPFAALFVLAVVFASMIFANEQGLFIILTAVFGVAALASLIATLFTLSNLSAAKRKVRLNEADSSTKIGREYASCSEELENLKKIYSSFNNDLS